MKTKPKSSLMNEAMTLAVRENTDLLIKAISVFDYPAFNHKSDPNKWSAGEIAEHLLMFDIRLNTILRTQSNSTKRDPQENIEAIAARLSDSSTPIEAPPFMIPSTTAKDPQAMIEKISSSRNQILQLTRDVDLTKVFPESPHRFYGVMSGIEWINFLIHHTNRHIEQLKKLK